MIIIYFAKNLFWTTILCKIFWHKLRNQPKSEKRETAGEAGYKAVSACSFRICLIIHYFLILKQDVRHFMRNVIHKPSCTRYQILFYFWSMETVPKLCKGLKYYGQGCGFGEMVFLQHRAKSWFNFSIAALMISTLHCKNKVTRRLFLEIDLQYFTDNPNSVCSYFL